MNFINPAVLWALPAAVLCCMLYWVYADSVRRRILKEGFNGNARSVLSAPKRFVRRTLLLGAILLLIIAAARPHWGEKPLEFNLAQTDALIVFDVSKSMLAEDVAPSRLEHGKWLLRKLIEENPETAFGITAFAGRAFLSCPVTGDRVSLLQCIDELDCDLVPVGGTNLAAALNSAVKSLHAAGGTTKEIILITDGEELSGNINKELEAIKKANIRLFVVGLGDPAVPALIRIENSNKQKQFMRDSAGNLVRTKLNEELLKKIAVATNGVYINSSNLNTGLEILTRELSKMPKDGKKAIRRALPIERFMLFMVPGFILLVLYMLIDELDKRKLSALLRVWLLSVLGICFTQNSYAAEVAENTEKKIAAESFDPVKLYNQARAVQLENKLSDAQKMYTDLLSHPLPDELKYKVLHNLGVSIQTAGRMKFAEASGISRTGDLDGAIKRLDEADKNMVQAEELYINALKSAADGDITAQVQQKQLADRKEISELKKKLEELKKRQQQAQEKTQQAQQKNNQQKQ
ncbi:MAG: VWA domain-containing protein, partial [Lentisphaeria bacterium]|nr:VWA domain-containing protein [Lentisphaeria bacterium]